MNNTETISYISIIVIVISLFFIGTELTGYAVTSNKTGLVNVTILSSAALNFSTALLDFGNGSVSGGAAILNSSGAGSVSGGTWDVEAGELVLENIGNIPVMLNLSANKSVANFIGGTGPDFEAVVSGVAGTPCVGNPSFSSFEDITTTPQTACTSFGWDTGNDTVNIDFKLTIPNNALGAKTVGIVAIGQYTP